MSAISRVQRELNPLFEGLKKKVIKEKRSPYDIMREEMHSYMTMRCIHGTLGVYNFKSILDYFESLCEEYGVTPVLLKEIADSEAKTKAVTDSTYRKLKSSFIKYASEVETLETGREDKLFQWLIVYYSLRCSGKF